MGLFSAISDAANAAVDVYQALGNAFVDGVQDAANGIVDVGQFVLESFVGDTFLSDVIDGVQVGVTGAVDLLQDGATFLTDTVQGIVTDLAGVIEPAFDQIVPDVIEEPIAEAVGFLADVLREDANELA